MGSDISKSAYRALLIQDPRLTYDDSYDTTATPTSSLPITQAGPRPGVPEAQQETELVLESGGVQAAAKTLNVRAQRAGHPRPGGGSFLHKYSTATGSLQWNGWDPPNVIHRFEWIDWSGGIQNRPDIIRRQDDGLVVVMQRGTSNIRCWRRVRDEDQVSPSWSESAVASGTWADEACPTVLELPSGRLLCFHFLELGSDLGQVTMLYSDDDGATWATGQESALAASIDMATFTLKGLRARYLNGQVLLVAWLTDTSTAPDQDVLVQYASNDLGASFTLISQTSNTTSRAYPAITVANSQFVVAYLAERNDEGFAPPAGGGEMTPIVCILGSAYQSLAGAEKILGCQSGNPMEWGTRSGGNGYFTSGDLALCTDEDGVLYMLGRDHDTAGGAFMECYTQRSTDNGQTWAMTGSGASVGYGAGWWRGNDTGVYPFDFAVAAQEGRLVVVGTFDSDTADALGNEDDESLFAIYLGGYTNVCLPNLAGAQAETSPKNRVAWERTFLPFAFPESYNGWTYTPTGAPTIDASAAGYLRYQGGIGDSATWSRTATPSGTGAEGLIVFAEYNDIATDNAAGGFFITIWLQAGASNNRASVRVRVTATALYLEDTSGANTGTDATLTAAFGSGAQILIEVTKTADDAANDARVHVWVRRTNLSHPVSEWTDLADGSVQMKFANYGTDPNASGNDINFGFLAGTNTVGSVRLVAFTHDEYVGDGLYGFVNPDDQLGRTYSAGYLYVNDGTRVKAVDGPAFRADTHNIATRYDYGVENVHPEVSPSPRRAWRSVSDNTNENLVWIVDAALDQNTELLGRSLGLYLGDINFRDATLYGYDDVGAAWVAIGTINAASGQTALSYRRRADKVAPNASIAGTPSDHYYTYEILAGSYIKLDPGQGEGSTVIRKILHNSEGAWRQDSGVTKVPGLLLEGVLAADPDGTAVGSTAEIWSKDVLLIVHDAAQYSKYRLYIPAQDTYEGYFRVGVRVLGHVAYLAHQYSWGRVIGHEHNTEVSTARSGTRRTRKLGPQRRVVEMAWTEGVYVSDIAASPPSPNWIGAYTTSSYPTAVPADTPYTVAGIHEMVGGADTPVVYLPLVPRAATSATDLMVVNRNLFVYGRLVGDPRLESIVGDEWTSPDGELVQVATITIEEEI